MRPIKTRRSNHNFGPPTGKEGEIGDLPCERVDLAGETTYYSVWEPSDSEREAIAAGHNVMLGVSWIGGFPPVSLGITHLTDAGVGDGHFVEGDGIEKHGIECPADGTEHELRGAD